MKRLLQPHFLSIAVGTAIYVVFYLVVTIYMSAAIVEYPRNSVAKALIGFIAFFPFLAAGYNTALNSHPAGVFNSVLVGLIVGILTILYPPFQAGNAMQEYPSVTEFLGSTASSLVVCSLGGVLGEVKRHFIPLRA